MFTAGHCASRPRRGGGRHHEPSARRRKIAILEDIVHPDYYTTLDAAILILEHPAALVEPRVIALDCIAEDYVDEGAHGGDRRVRGDRRVGERVEHRPPGGLHHDLRPGLRRPLLRLLRGRCPQAGSSSPAETASTPARETAAGRCTSSRREGDYLVGITSRARSRPRRRVRSRWDYVRADALVDRSRPRPGRTLIRPECDGRNRVPSPTSGAIEVVRGGTGVTVIDPNDPDADQDHTYTMVEPPKHGLAQIDPAGAVYYLAPDGSWATIGGGRSDRQRRPAAVGRAGDPDPGVARRTRGGRRSERVQHRAGRWWLARPPRVGAPASEALLTPWAVWSRLWDPSFVVALEPLDPPPDLDGHRPRAVGLAGFRRDGIHRLPADIVTSPRTADGTALLASDPAGGPRTGVRILRSDTTTGPRRSAPGSW